MIYDWIGSMCFNANQQIQAFNYFKWNIYFDIEAMARMDFIISSGFYDDVIIGAH